MPQEQRLLPAQMLEQYLERWDVPGRDRIIALSTCVAEELEHWAAHYPLMRRVRILPLAMSVTAAAPFSDVSALVDTARVSLWVFALDDLFDEGGLTTEELLARVHRYQAIAGGEGGRYANDDMEDALYELREGLTRYPLFPALGGEWAAAMRGTVDGMIQEYRWRQRYRLEGAAMLPDYEAYLACGRYSIGGPPHIWSALITVDDPSTPEHLATLRPMERIASTCIRLANDLQSHDREVAEGKFNALEILSQQSLENGVQLDRAGQLAVARVKADIAAGLWRLADLSHNASSHTGQPEAAIVGIARFVCRFYDRHDFHTFAPVSSHQ